MFIYIYFSNDNVEAVPPAQPQNVNQISYIVEKIIGKRETENGIIEYFIKWLGFDLSESTWEPEKNLNCATLIEDFEKSIQAMVEGVPRIAIPLHEVQAVENELNASVNIIPHANLEPEKILGAASDASGELQFLIKWKSSYLPDLVSSTIANREWPELVIQFYEERLTFE